MAKKVLFRINLDPEKDADVIEALNKCPRPLRGEYVAEAVRLLREHVLKSQGVTESEENDKKTDSGQPNLDFGSFFK